MIARFMLRRMAVRTACAVGALVGFLGLGWCADNGVSLGYKHSAGQIERCTIVVDGGGYAKDPLRTQQSRLHAEVVERQEVAKVGPADTATLKSIWESAKITVDGSTAEMNGPGPMVESRVGGRGQVLWMRSQGRERTFKGDVQIDPAQLSLLDWVTDQALCLELPDGPLQVGQDWKTVERAEYEFTTAEMTRVAKLDSLGTGDKEGTCTIASDVSAPLQLNFEADGVRFTGEVSGTMQHRFDYRAGRLLGGEGRLVIDLNGGPINPPPEQTPDTGPGLDFAVRMEFAFHLTCERVEGGKAAHRP
jgi:hypothetical protein